MCSRTGSRSFRASSGSRSANSSIEDFVSAKRTVIFFRSPSSAAFDVRMASADGRGDKQREGEIGPGQRGGRPPANSSASRLTTPPRQCGQVRASRVPHSPQNLAPAGFVAWHRGHRIEQVAKETNGDAGEPGEYTEYRRRNSDAGSSGGNRLVSLDSRGFWCDACHSVSPSKTSKRRGGVEEIPMNRLFVHACPQC